jgi:hypothetical protein
VPAHYGISPEPFLRAATDLSAQPPGRLISLAIGLRTHLGEAEVLTNAVRLLLAELGESSLSPRIRDEWWTSANPRNILSLFELR